MEGLATKIPLTKLITTAGILSMFPRPFGILLEKLKIKMVNFKL